MSRPLTTLLKCVANTAVTMIAEGVLLVRYFTAFWGVVARLMVALAAILSSYLCA